MKTVEVAQTSTMIRLTEIHVSETNRIFRRAHEVTKEALQELASSIAQYGVLQPVLVRPYPQAEGKYVLIFGERRYRASMLAGRTDIPAYIKDANDDVAFEIQVIENLQREDVHPLNEGRRIRDIDIASFEKEQRKYVRSMKPVQKSGSKNCKRTNQST